MKTQLQLNLMIGISLLFSSFMQGQNIEQNLKKQIIEFYFNNNQILVSDKQIIFDEFDKLIEIHNISDGKVFKNETPGFYEIRLSISHTEIYLLEYQNINDFKFHKTDPDNFILLVEKMVFFFKSNNISRKDILLALENLIRIYDTNLKMNQNLRIKEM